MSNLPPYQPPPLSHGPISPETRRVIAKRIRIRMIELDIATQADLARRAGVVRVTIVRVLRGQLVNLTTYEQIARAVNLSIVELIQPIGKPAPVWNAETTEIATAYQAASTVQRLHARRLLLGRQTVLEETARMIVDQAVAESEPAPPIRPPATKPHASVKRRRYPDKHIA